MLYEFKYTICMSKMLQSHGAVDRTQLSILLIQCLLCSIVQNRYTQRFMEIKLRWSCLMELFHNFSSASFTFCLNYHFLFPCAGLTKLHFHQLVYYQGLECPLIIPCPLSALHHTSFFLSSLPAVSIDVAVISLSRISLFCRPDIVLNPYR